MTWKIKKFEDLTTLELHNIVRERINVFVVEQNCVYEELDGLDLKSYHLFKEENNNIVAYLRILPKGLVYDEVAIGRVLTVKEYRGQGFFTELMEKAINFIENELNEKTIKISAQEYLRKAYGKFGFKEVSEVYLDVNIPHVEMVYSK
ncbi:MAG: GNAT family N-acetyltransferase [Clostridium argentinense]|uniref:GNAT family N-acetyltransferase n=1 Tax=Clostridium butanoliproducens TaxID=2991837 RepID=UPI001D61CBE2|nr:GNAT family N-acetyltransferase [Clostridium butanoliproducens]MBS5822818.1 GNAT family N-acetyltransferase [Clostridium argentinense]MDU1349686.1 GNAT family N-acetyltransferase [Clostridium argentinense]